MWKTLKDLLALAVIVALILFASYLYINFKDKTVGDIYTDYMQSIIKKEETGTIFEGHPIVNSSTESEDYTFAMKQIQTYNVRLSSLDQYLFNGIHDGTLEYIYSGSMERDAGKFYIYGDGNVYRVYCSPAEICAMPILSSIVINNYQGAKALETRKCTNAWQVYWGCGGLGDAIKYDLYGKLS